MGSHAAGQYQIKYLLHFKLSDISKCMVSKVEETWETTKAAL